MSSELYIAHHGILGMKWGKKNGPPYPLDEADHSSSEKKAGWKKSVNISNSSKKLKVKDNKNMTIKKGTEMYRVSDKETETGDTRYVSYRDNDRAYYQGYWSKNLKDGYITGKPAENVYEQTYKLTEDLHIPSAEIRKEVAAEMAKDPSVYEEIKKLYTSHGEKPPSMSDLQDHPSSQIFSMISMNQSLMEKYGKALLERGFNATIDDNGKHNLGDLPIIMLKADSTLVQTGSHLVDELTSVAGIHRYNQNLRNIVKNKNNVANAWD